MVLRGAHEHPGAVAVEDEQGRMLNLAKLSLQVWQLAKAYAACVPQCLEVQNARLQTLQSTLNCLRSKKGEGPVLCHTRTTQITQPLHVCRRCAEARGAGEAAGQQGGRRRRNGVLKA